MTRLKEHRLMVCARYVRMYVQNKMTKQVTHTLYNLPLPLCGAKDSLTRISSHYSFRSWHHAQYYVIEITTYLAKLPTRQHVIKSYAYCIMYVSRKKNRKEAVYRMMWSLLLCIECILHTAVHCIPRASTYISECSGTPTCAHTKFPLIGRPLGTVRTYVCTYVT